MTKSELTQVQGRLFESLDSPLTGKVQSERSVMDFPLFALSKVAQMEEIKYDLEGVSIRIKPSSTGVATMWDKEILIYVSSVIANRMQETGEVIREVKFNTHDFFRVTGVPRPSKRDYERFTGALARLQGTQIQTNIKTGNMGTRGFFSWFAEANADTRTMPDGSEQLLAVRVQICDWLARAITRDNRMYNYHHEYFKLGPIERRLYELAHCYCADGAYEMPLEVLAAKIGSQASMAKLKTHLKRIASEGRLPAYEIALEEVLPSEPALDSRGRRITRLDTVVVLKPKAKAIGRSTNTCH